MSKDATSRSPSELAALEAENSRLREEIANLRSRLTSLLRSPVDDSVTRVFRLVSEKNELATQLTERVADLSSRLSILEDSHASVTSDLERSRKLTSIFRQIVETSPMPVLCADLEGIINYANGAARAAFPEIKGGEVTDLAAISSNGVRLALDKLLIKVVASPDGKVSHRIRSAARRNATVHASALQVEGRAIGIALVFDL